MVNNRIDNRIIALVLAAAVTTFLLMVAGNALRVIEGAQAVGAQACPDWPTCYGTFGLPAGLPLTEPLGVALAHRWLAGLALLLTFTAALAARLRFAGGALVRWGTRPLAAAVLLMGISALLGGVFALLGAVPLVSALHTGLALAALGLVTAALVAVFYQRARPEQAGRLAFCSPFARLTRLALLGLFVLLISGTLVSLTGAGSACAGWPLCGSGFDLPHSGLGWLAFTHRLLVAAVGVLLTVQFLRAWKTQRTQVVLLPAATGAFLLMLGQAFIGALSVTRSFPADLLGLHAAAAAGLWAVQVVLVVAAGFEARSAQDEAAEEAEPLALRRRALDFVILSKPIIVALLLVTTYTGMVVGGREIPTAALAFWTMLGGALAAGGSSALNQFIDRDIDKEMQRTANRPIPGGRLQPAEGLAYGLGACLAAFFLLAGTVNLLAAVLSLAGMIYYVLIYSIWLKHITVQNIVIGGGAGAIPPLVGWAAATGSLNVPALFLFAIIFFWTPPHFWALALVRRKDYARGRVPMLPVIRGVAETRKQILIYTIELVALTLLLPIFKMAGTVYLVSALALGLWLIATAWRVYKNQGNKPAWKMYRYSSMYLMFLMIAMVADVFF